MSTNFRNFLEEQLTDEELKKEYDSLEPEFNIIRAMIDARKNKEITQKELSKRTGISQGDISKLETGNANPTLAILKRLAEAMDMQLKIEFIPKVSTKLMY